MIFYSFPLVEQPIKLDDSKINVLVIENSSMLYQTVLNLISFLSKQESEFRFLTQNDEYKDIDKIYFACDVFNLDLNSRKLTSIVSKQLVALFQTNEFVLNEYYSKGYSLFSQLTEQLDIPLTINEELDIPALIKLFNPAIEYSHDTLLEKMIDLLNVLVQLTNLKVFVTLNIQDYLTLEEADNLFKHCRYKEVSWLSIQANRKYVHSEEHCVLIDSDLCHVLE